MRMPSKKFFQSSLSLALLVFGNWPIAARCQDMLGTHIGIPESCPTVLWPQGMSLEALSPNNLYPNGSQFGLSNTSGGFGMFGSGAMSGVGLAQRTVSLLVQEELERPTVFIRRLSELERAEAIRSGSQFSLALSQQYSPAASGRAVPLLPRESRPALSAPWSMPSVDATLKDRPATVDSILNTGI